MNKRIDNYNQMYCKALSDRSQLKRLLVVFLVFFSPLFSFFESISSNTLFSCKPVPRLIQFVFRDISRSKVFACGKFRFSFVF